MANRNLPAPPHELVEDLDTVFERAASWVAANPRPVIALLATVLAIGLAVSITAWVRDRSAQRAQAEIAGLYAGYLEAMGAPTGAYEAPEPANPELGRKARDEFAAKLLAASLAHEGSAAAAEGRLQAAELLERNGDADGAFAARKLAAENAPSRTPVRAIALARYAVALESKGETEAAAEALEQAGAIESPGQALMLADAARVNAALGKREHAIELFERAEEIGIEAVPPHIKDRIAELRASTK